MFREFRVGQLTIDVQPSLQNMLLLTARAVARQGAMVQCRRALKPDGLFLSAMWGGSTLQVHGLVVRLSFGTVHGKDPRVKYTLCCKLWTLSSGFFAQPSHVLHPQSCGFARGALPYA